MYGVRLINQETVLDNTFVCSTWRVQLRRSLDNSPSLLTLPNNPNLDEGYITR
jgi:hypothetical protein